MHIAVPDHRIPIYESTELVHRWHPLFNSLRNAQVPSVRMLVRIKPDGSGPLGEMCGCC